MAVNSNLLFMNYIIFHLELIVSYLLGDYKCILVIPVKRARHIAWCREKLLGDPKVAHTWSQQVPPSLSSYFGSVSPLVIQYFTKTEILVCSAFEAHSLTIMLLSP